jgi:hypothetical protein
VAKARNLSGKLVGWVRTGPSRAGSAIRTGWRSALRAGAQQLRTTTRWLTFVWRLRGPVLLALGAGSAIGLACYVAGPLVASVVSGVSGTWAALDAQVRRMHRRVLWSNEHE